VAPVKGPCLMGVRAGPTKLNATGSALVYSTYLGATDAEGFAIAVDSRSGSI
jgi:hypothetical protein